MDSPFAPLPTPTDDQRVAIFAGGCFWCMEPPFDALDGVVATTAGYTGGVSERPTYNEITTGRSGHYEAVHVIYDPQRVSYRQLVETFWRSVDPTQRDGQFADRGPQYRTAIFVLDADQRTVAEASKRELAASGIFDRPIATEILDAVRFWPAESYHQDYYRKQQAHYQRYKVGSGRAGFLERTWQGR